MANGADCGAWVYLIDARGKDFRMGEDVARQEASRSAQALRFPRQLGELPAKSPKVPSLEVLQSPLSNLLE